MGNNANQDAPKSGERVEKQNFDAVLKRLLNSPPDPKPSSKLRETKRKTRE